jgi:hypothetical protein
MKYLSNYEYEIYRWLYNNGWYPKKNFYHRNIDIFNVPYKIINNVHVIFKSEPGYPDFMCSNNRWVEAKSISTETITFIQKNQWEIWKRLMENGDKIYLIYYNKSKFTHPIEVNSKLTILRLLKEIEDIF